VEIENSDELSVNSEQNSIAAAFRDGCPLALKLIAEHSPLTTTIHYLHEP